MPSIDVNIENEMKIKSKLLSVGRVAEMYIEQHFGDKLLVYTDGSKDPESGRTGAAVFIPKYKVAIKKRTRNQLSVYTVELIAMLTALQWLEENN